MAETKRKSGRQTAATAEEIAERKATGKTQGRRGVKSERINITIAPDNHKFLLTMAKITGSSISTVLDKIVRAYRRSHPDLEATAQQAIDALDADFYGLESDDE